MNDNVIPFELPSRKPKIVQKEAPPDQRKFCVMPLRAIKDKRLNHGSIRVLAMLCAYCNRAGITWVGQQRLADDLQITKQAVNKQIKALKELGYLELIKHGFRAKQADTLRVIFDDNITTDDAIAITSSIEDTRPPHIIKQEESLMTTLPKLTGMGKPKRAKIKPTDSITTREMKEQINAHHDNLEARAKRLKQVVKQSKGTIESVDNPVDNSLITSPIVNLQVDSVVNPQVDRTHQEHISINLYIKVYKELINKLFKLERLVNEQDKLVMQELINAGLTLDMWTDIVTDILTTMKDKRQDPPHRIGYFRDGILRALA